MYFHRYSKYKPSNSSICESYIKPVGIFGNHISKYPDIRRKIISISLQTIKMWLQARVSFIRGRWAGNTLGSGRNQTLRKILLLSVSLFTEAWPKLNHKTGLINHYHHSTPLPPHKLFHDLETKKKFRPNIFFKPKFFSIHNIFFYRKICLYPQFIWIKKI